MRRPWTGWTQARSKSAGVEGGEPGGPTPVQTGQQRQRRLDRGGTADREVGPHGEVVHDLPGCPATVAVGRVQLSVGEALDDGAELGRVVRHAGDRLAAIGRTRTAKVVGASRPKIAVMSATGIAAALWRPQTDTHRETRRVRYGTVLSMTTPTTEQRT